MTTVCDQGGCGKRRVTRDMLVIFPELPSLDASRMPRRCHRPQNAVRTVVLWPSTLTHCPIQLPDCHAHTICRRRSSRLGALRPCAPSTSGSAATTWRTAVTLYSTRPCPLRNAPISLQHQRMSSIQVGGGLIGRPECEGNRCAAPFERSEETTRESASDTYELVCIAIGDAPTLQIR
jgi:hypothetical protein